MRTDSHTRASASHITKKGEEIYQERLQATLEPAHRGEYVVIEPESGDYFIGEDPHEANQKAQSKHPDKVFYLKRIGHTSAFRFPHYVSTVATPKDD